MEALVYWEKVNDHAQAINEDLLARGKKPMPPSWMYLRLFEHMKNMGMDVLTQVEIDTGCADPDHLIKDHLSQCIKEWDVESRRVSKEKKAAFKKQSA